MEEMLSILSQRINFLFCFGFTLGVHRLAWIIRAAVLALSCTESDLLTLVITILKATKKVQKNVANKNPCVSLVC